MHWPTCMCQEQTSMGHLKQLLQAKQMITLRSPTHRADEIYICLRLKYGIIGCKLQKLLVTSCVGLYVLPISKLQIVCNLNFCFSCFLVFCAFAMTYLEPVDQFFLYCVLCRGVRGYTQTFCSLSEPLLLILVLGVGRCSLTAKMRKKTQLTDTAHNNNSEQRSASELQPLREHCPDDRMRYLALSETLPQPSDCVVGICFQFPLG